MADLDYEGALRFARAQAQPGTLEQVLGLGVNLPIALAQAKENERRKMSLLQMLQNPATATPPMPMGVDEALKLQQIKALGLKPPAATEEQKTEQKMKLEKFKFGLMQQAQDLRPEEQEFIKAIISGSDDPLVLERVRSSIATRALKKPEKSLETRANEKKVLSAAGAEGLASVEKPMSAEASKLAGNADDAINAVKEMRELLPKLTRAELAVAQTGEGLLSKGARVIAGSNVQRMHQALSKAWDILARFRTGAQINNYEFNLYGSLLLDWAKNPEVNAQALNDFEKYVQGVKDMATAGRMTGKNIDEPLPPNIDSNPFKKSSFLKSIPNMVPSKNKQVIEEMVPIQDAQGRQFRVRKSKLAEKLKMGYTLRKP